jgi:AraC-like DNA-binding protein
VESIWVQEARVNGRGTRRRPTLVLPTGTPELVLYYGDPFVRLHDGGYEREPTLAFGGQRTRAVRVAATGTTGIVIVRFHPWGAAPLFREPMVSFRDRFVPLDAFAGRDASVLQQRLLCDARDWRQRVHLLEGFLEGRLRAKTADRLASQAVACIRRRRGSEPIHRLASRLGVSRRHLSRVCATVVGVSPKQLASLLRFQESLRYRGSGTDWADAAVACGYHDQAHLIRSWNEIAGAPPARLLERSGTIALGEFFNDAAMSHSYNTTYL